MTRRWCAVSVDLDEIGCYRALYALPAREAGSRAVHDTALARIAAFARAERLPLTLFAVGRELTREQSAEALRRLSAAGHLVESHSLSHRYDLTRLSGAELRREIEGAQDAIAAVTGRRPCGFRAPGYTIDDRVLDALEGAGIAFDSSVFPCPPYYAAKALALGWMRLRARPSASRLDTPWVLTAPRQPYRPGRPWHRRGRRRLLELPITVSWLGAPLLGTALTLAGPRAARALARSAAGPPFLNLELHGIDFLDARDGIEDLRGHQPDVPLPVGRKQRAIGAALDALRRAGYTFVTLAEAASAWSEDLEIRA